MPGVVSANRLSPLDPDVPLVPDVPAVPEEPLVPDVPSLPEVPDVPLDPSEPDVPAVPAVFFAYGCLVSLVSCQLDFLTFTLAIPTRVEPFSFVLGVLLIRANHQVVGVYAGSVVAQVSDYFPFSHQFSV